MLNIDPDQCPNIVIGVGDPNTRKKMYEEKIKLGFQFPSIIHTNTIVSSHSTIEDAVIIGPYSTVLSGSTVKKGACLLSCVNINHDIVVNKFSLVGANVSIGNNSILGEGCHITMGKIIKPNSSIDAGLYYE